jgi:hypothetical protein
MTRNPASNDNSSVLGRRGSWLKAAGAILGIMAALILVLVAALYVARRPVAAFLAERYLAGIGIPAEIVFSELSFEGFSARVRLGAVAAPDFDAETVEARLDLPSSFSIPKVVSARLANARLRLKYDGKDVSFGVLGPLVGANGTSKGNAPLPDIVIENATLIADTPYGVLQFAMNANIAKGKLERFETVLQPVMLKTVSFSAAIGGGRMTATPVGDLLNIDLSVDADSITAADGIVGNLHASGDIRGLQWVNENGVTRFRVQSAAFALGAASANATLGSAMNPSLAVRFGDASGTVESGHVTAIAPMNAELNAGTLDISGARLKSASAQIAMSSASIDTTNGATAFSGPVRVQAEGKGFSIAETTAGRISLNLGTESGTAEFSGASWSVAGAMHVVLDGDGVKQTTPGGIATAAFHAAFDGPAKLGSDDVSATVAGSLSGDASFPERAARDFARTVPLLGGDETFVAGLTAALRSVSVQMPGLSITQSKGETGIALNAPATFAGSGGAKLAISPQARSPAIRFANGETNGALTIDSSGARLPTVHLALTSYRASKDAWDASAGFDAHLDFGDVRGIRFSGAGELRAAGPRITFASARCAEMHFDTFLANGAPFISAANGRLCGEPNRSLFASDGSGWRFGGRWEGATGVFEILQSGLSAGEGRVELSGNAAGLTSGNFEVTKGLLSDRLTAPRFREIAIVGHGALTSTDLNTMLALTARNRSFASVAIKQSIANGNGSATIDAPSVNFVPGQFQPADISPLLAAFGTRVAGRTNFTGQLAWKDGTITSGGHLTASNIGFQSPMGQVREANADIAFDSLIPVISAQRQRFTAERIESFVPLEKAAATFSFTQDAVRIESASASMAGGSLSIDPMTYVFAPEATTLGTIKLQNVDLTPLLTTAGIGTRVATDAHIEGVVPFSNGPEGLRFANGRIAANAPGRLSIKRDALVASADVGAGGAAPPNAVQDFAYQALENLAFDQLEGTVNSLPMGRLGVLFHIVGRNDPPQAAEARVSIADLIRGTAFDKPIPLPKGTPVDLRLDTSVNLDELLAGYRQSASP